MYCGCGTTYGDDFRFYRHAWWCSSDCMAVALHLSLLALRGTYATGISPPMARKFDSSFTHGDSFGFPSHLWRYPSDGIAEAPPLLLPAIHGTHATGTSPPMARNADSGFTHGDGFGFRRHLWRYSSDRMAAAPRLSLLAVRSTRTTGISPPMEMNFDCGFTHGGGLGFRRHLWRSPADGVAEAPPSSLPAIHGPPATGTRPHMPRECESGLTHGDGYGFRRHLWRYSSDRMAAAPRLSLLAVRSTRATGISRPMEMNFDCGFTHGGGLGFRRHLWRSPADGVAKAPPSSLSALLGPAARRKSPHLETNLGGNSTDGDDVRLDRRLWRGHLGQRLTRLAISRRTES